MTPATSITGSPVMGLSPKAPKSFWAPWQANIAPDTMRRRAYTGPLNLPSIGFIVPPHGSPRRAPGGNRGVVVQMVFLFRAVYYHAKPHMDHVGDKFAAATRRSRQEAYVVKSLVHATQVLWAFQSPGEV